MLKQESSTLCFKGSTMMAHVCDMCRSARCTVFCRADLAYLCTGCDTRVHVSSRHERVLVCEACERAPAAFICKADAASLCAACDANIHSANPLARRHERVPVVPVLGPLYGPPLSDPDPRFIVGPGVESEGTVDNEDEDEVASASWLLFDAPKNENENGFLFNGEGGVDEFLDLVEYNSCQDTQFSDDRYTNDDNNDNTSNVEQQNRGYAVVQKGYGAGDVDSVVPIRFEEAEEHHRVCFRQQKFELGMEYESSNGGYGYPASLGHRVSMSSLDAGIVPDSTIIEVSISNTRTSKGTIDLFSNPPVQIPTQLTPMDREARVLRYREKKKTRKFEKTIRYASRKAYAETRPRIKGRFAKRTNVDEEVEQMFSTSLMTEGEYCIVPSF